MFLTSFLYRIDMYDGTVEEAQLMKELMVDLAGYRMPLGNREIWGNCDVYLCPKPVAQPPCPRLRHFFHPRDMSCSVPNLLYHLWFYSV